MKYEKILELIEQKAGKSKEDIEALIESKRTEFGGLISAEGAAHIIAKESGININEKEIVKISDIQSSPASVEGKVIKVLGSREFEKNGRKGKVANLLLADTTGSIRVVLWDKDADKVMSGTIKDGSGLRISNGIVKDGMNGKELSPGRFGRIDEIEPPKVTQVIKQEVRGERLKISQLTERNGVEIRGCVTKIFDSKLFFNNGDKEALMISSVIDDGTGSIRCVFFREVAESLIGMNTDDALKKFKDIGKDALAEEFRQVCGKEIIVKGRAKINNYSEALEIVANGVSDVDTKIEIEKLMENVGV